MKKLMLIVHAEVQGALADALRGIPEVSGFTFAPVEGHGPQALPDENLSARDRVVGYVPHVCATLLLDDGAVDQVLSALKQSDCGVKDRGIYWVSPVEKQGRL